MHGTVTAFDAATGHGKLVCTEGGAQYDFCNPQPYGGAMRRGDSVVFELGEKGVARDVVPEWRRSSTAPVAARPDAPPVQPGTAPAGPGLEACCGVVPVMAVANTRDTCMCCGKSMTPTLSLVSGMPVRSFCPFCAAVHRDFTPPARVGVKDYAAEGLFTAALTAVFPCLLWRTSINPPSSAVGVWPGLHARGRFVRPAGCGLVWTR